ncbi:hypothetical protein ACLB2K_011875 [Fragaria x ananassa]
MNANVNVTMNEDSRADNENFMPSQENNEVEPTQEASASPITSKKRYKKLSGRMKRCKSTKNAEIATSSSQDVDLRKKSSTKRRRLEHNCKERVASFPFIYKKKRARRSRMIGLEALANVAELHHKMATESLKATATTSPSFQTQPTVKESVVPLPVEQVKHNVSLISEPSDADLVDFRGLAVLPRPYVSLLEKACICHPNLAICSKKSLRWREFAYKILGELLFFLTSTRRIEMTHKAYKQLEELWEDAKCLGFDLSWLAPIIDSELDSCSNLERICLLETEKEILKERRNTLCCQLTTLTMQLCETKKELADLRKVIRFFKEDAASTENEYLYTDL